MPLKKMYFNNRKKNFDTIFVKCIFIIKIIFDLVKVSVTFLLKML